MVSSRAGAQPKLRFRDVLASGKFAVTAELGPPKGTDIREMIEGAEILHPVVDAVNLTDNQSSVMRMNSLAASLLVKQGGSEPIFQVTCRDRNRLGLQSDLLGAAALGIDNVLSLTGDYPTAGDHPSAKPVFDLESVQLIEVINQLNSGKDMAGNDLEGPTDYFVGAVVAPDAIPLEPQLAKFEKKVQVGARFFQTQSVFDTERFAAFMQEVRKITAGRDVRILASVMLLKSGKMARFLNRCIPGITVPEPLIETLEASESPSEAGLELAARTVSDLTEIADGVHIMAMAAEAKVPVILERAGLREPAPTG